MTRALVPLGLAAFLSAGCVPVAEPLSDIDKAEREKALVGTWPVTRAKGSTDFWNISSVTVDAPDVKGNPKGLMRAHVTFDAAAWFFTTAVGKHTYATVLFGAGDGNKLLDLHEAGEYAKWLKEPKKRYFVFRYTLDGDALTIDVGDLDTFTKLMDDAKIGKSGYFATPAGWLAKYLDKNGPDKVFDKTNSLTLKREKKK